MKETLTTRAEHLQWCKDRALAELDPDGVPQAWASMCSDLGKHPETENHAAIELGMLMLISGHLSTTKQMRDFINGFN